MKAGPFTQAGGVAVLLALTGTGAAWSALGGRIFSPGDLSGATGELRGGVESHAALDDRCASCHAPPWSAETLDGRCLSCHTEVEAERIDPAALHGGFGRDGACTACHTEHAGREADLTRFDPASVDHGRFGFALTAHRTTADGDRFACGDCHAPDTWTFPDADCRECHARVDSVFTGSHVEDWGDGCRTCHDGVDRFSGFDHDRTGLPLTGGHGESSCIDCHLGVRSPEDFASAAGDCVDCHAAEDVHRGEFGTDCASCHSSGTWEDARFEHEFPLSHGRRGPSECLTCHADAPESYDTYTCYGCHEHSPARIRAEHRGERVQDIDDCVRCHATGREHEREGGEGREGRRGRGRDRGVP